MEAAWVSIAIGVAGGLLGGLITGVCAFFGLRTWLPMNFTLTFTRQWSGGMAVNTVQATVEIRNKDTEEVLASATITLVATP